MADLNSSRRDLRERFYVLADAACQTAIQNAHTAAPLSPSVLTALRDAALAAFDDVVAPFASPTLNPAIIQSRTSVLSALLNAA